MSTPKKRATRTTAASRSALPSASARPAEQPPVPPRFFPTPASFRTWLAEHHASANELWLGYHRKHTGKPTLTWQESVAVALCFGWIDGIRKSVYVESF